MRADRGIYGLKSVTVNEMLLSGAWAALMYNNQEVIGGGRKHVKIRIAVGEQEVFMAVIHIADELSWGAVIGTVDGVGLFTMPSGGKPEFIIGVKETYLDGGTFTVTPE